jgi:hypothetical protein
MAEQATELRCIINLANWKSLLPTIRTIAFPLNYYGAFPAVEVHSLGPDQEILLIGKKT